MSVFLTSCKVWKIWKYIYNAPRIPIWKTDNEKCTISFKFYQYDDFNFIIKTLCCNIEKASIQQVNQVHKQKLNISCKVLHKWMIKKKYSSIIMKNCSFYFNLILFIPILLLVFWLGFFFFPFFYLLLCN